MRSLRFISLAMVGVLLFTSACAHRGTREERRECRRARARAAGRGVGIAIGAVVVAAVLVVAAAGGGGNLSGLGGSGRSRNRRRRGLEVCRDRTPRPSHAQTLPAPAAPRAPPAQPPSRDELQAAVVALQDRLVACRPEGARELGDLVLDVEIDGSHGAIGSYAMDGPPVAVLPGNCVSEALRGVHFPPFEGVVEVRWKVPL